MVRVLVTGASGQLAPAVARVLVRDGCDVTLLARRPVETVPDARSIVLGDAWTRDALSSGLSGSRFDALVNLAGAGVRPGHAEAGSLYRVNVQLPARLLSMDLGLRAFVNLGSGAEYEGSASQAPLDERAPLTRTHPYGLSKAAAGLAGTQLAQESDIGFAHLRLFGAYGEHEAPHRLLPTLVAKLSQGAVASLSDGSQVRDWLYEEDVACAVSLAVRGLADRRIRSGIYNLGSGTGVSVRRFAELVADIVPAARSLLGFGAIPRRAAEENHLVADTCLFRSASGWEPRYTLEAGLRQAVARLGRA